MATTEVPNGVAGMGATQNGDNKETEDFKLRFCTVCASNQNRCGTTTLASYVASHCWVANIQPSDLWKAICALPKQAFP